MNQAADPNLSHGDRSIKKSSYTDIVKRDSPLPSLSPPPSIPPPTCTAFFRDPAIPEGMNLHASSSHRTSLIFQLKKRHHPVKVAQAVCFKYKKSIAFYPKRTRHGHESELVFDRMDDYQDCYNDLKKGFDYEGDLLVPLVPTPTHFNSIIKVSIHNLPDEMSSEELTIQLAPYGRMLEAGRYTYQVGKNYVYLGEGYALLAPDEDSKEIPTSSHDWKDRHSLALKKIASNTTAHTTTTTTTTTPNNNTQPTTTQSANRRKTQKLEPKNPAVAPMSNNKRNKRSKVSNASTRTRDGPPNNETAQQSVLLLPPVKEDAPPPQGHHHQSVIPPPSATAADDPQRHHHQTTTPQEPEPEPASEQDSTKQDSKVSKTVTAATFISSKVETEEGLGAAVSLIGRGLIIEDTNEPETNAHLPQVSMNHRDVGPITTTTTITELGLDSHRTTGTHNNIKRSPDPDSNNSDLDLDSIDPIDRDSNDNNETDNELFHDAHDDIDIDIHDDTATTTTRTGRITITYALAAACSNPIPIPGHFNESEEGASTLGLFFLVCLVATCFIMNP
ncbi:hypothetical protein BG004_001756 [Podila humilis]|nr:hypothetical protein BG004_001756 [Podila humilis]